MNFLLNTRHSQATVIFLMIKQLLRLGRFNDRPVVVIGLKRVMIRIPGILRNLVWQGPRVIESLSVLDMLTVSSFPLLHLSIHQCVSGKVLRRGQANDRRTIEKCLTVRVPLVSIIIAKEARAVALASANKSSMLEHSIYSVISLRVAHHLFGKMRKNEKAAVSKVDL